MTARTENTSFLSTIGLLLTYRCTIHCPHCFAEAGPGRKEKMALGSALGWIDEIAAYRDGCIRSVELTGGEPFFDLQTLALVSDHAMKAGLSITAATNAGWAGTLEQAILTLNELPGIRKISISTDVYHQQFIPDGHIHNAVIAAELLGRRYDITVTTESEQDERYLKVMERLERIVARRLIGTRITLPVGRALKPARSCKRKLSQEPSSKPCGSSVPLILPDGRLIACSGPMTAIHDPNPLSLGNLRRESLSSILERAETNPLLHLIRVWGPHRMVSLLQSRGHGDLLPKEYLCGSSCDICSRLLCDKRLAEILTQILNEPENRNVIAYAQRQRLSNTETLHRYRVDGTGQIDATNALLQSDI